jgi:hypothetical protein
VVSLNKTIAAATTLPDTDSRTVATDPARAVHLDHPSDQPVRAARVVGPVRQSGTVHSDQTTTSIGSMIYKVIDCRSIR